MLSLRGTLLALCLAAAAVAQQGDPPVPRALLDREQCQTSLPGENYATRSGGRTREPGNEARREPRGEPRGGPTVRLSAAGGADFATVLMWVGVTVAALVLIAALVRASLGERALRDTRQVVVARGKPVSPAAAAAIDLPDYERFAAAGDFAAAVHALLAHAIAAWTRTGGAAPQHATARDVLRRVRAAGAAFDPFAELVQAVECVHFGGAAADRGSFEASRDQLQRWESACRPHR
jgi:hypothetical protein